MKAKLTATRRVAAIAIAVATVISASQVRAQQQLTLISGATTITLNATDGEISYNGMVGNWNVNVVTGLATPTEPQGVIDLDSIDLTSLGTSDSLYIDWDGAGYTQAGPYLATVGGTISPGITAAFGSFYSGANTLTPILSFNNSTAFSSSFSGNNTGTAPGPAPFDLAESVLITGGTAANSQISFNFNVESVPEPSTISLLATGLLGAWTIRRRKA